MLTQYLSRNWKAMDTVTEANALDLRPEGLVCIAPPPASLAAHSRSSTSSTAFSNGSADSSVPTLARADGATGSATLSRAIARVESMQSTGGANGQGAASEGSRRLARGAASTASVSSYDGTGSSRSASVAGNLDRKSSHAWRRARRNWQRAYQVCCIVIPTWNLQSLCEDGSFSRNALCLPRPCTLAENIIASLQM